MRDRVRQGLRAVAAQARRPLRTFARAEGGIAVLEFALIVPILLVAYFGTIEIANIMSNTRKVDLLSRTLGEFFGAHSAPTRLQVDAMFKSSKIVLLPYDGTDIEIVVSAVGVYGATGQGPMRVCSSVAVSGSMPRMLGAVPPVTVPPDLSKEGARMVLVEVRMKYKPLAGQTFAALFGQRVDGITFSRDVLWPVRSGRRYASQTPEVIMPAGLPCPVQ